MNQIEKQVIEAARGKTIVLPAISGNGEHLGPWVACSHCKASYRTPQCPSCEPVIRRLVSQTN